MLYKIIHRLVELPLPGYIAPAARAIRGSVKFVQPATSVNPYSYKYSFFLFQSEHQITLSMLLL